MLERTSFLKCQDIRIASDTIIHLNTILDFIPTAIIITEVTTPKSTLIYVTNRIEMLVLGSASLGIDGYSPERFTNSFLNQKHATVQYTNGTA